ncbi:condensation domain-containing protein, partial [Ruminiclostridium cellobioparum]
GGHSLKATFLVNRIHKELNAELPLGRLFETPTIAGLAEYIRDAEKKIYATIEPVEEKEYYPVSSAQKRMYITSRFDGIGIGYNTPMAVIAEGNIDSEKFEEAVKALIRRHEVFRTSFEVVGDEVVQRIHKELDFSIEYLEVSEEETDNIVKKFIKPFDLGIAPLLRVGLIKQNKNKYVIIWDMHHIITDGVSLGLLLKEFTAFYEGRVVPNLRLQYKDFAYWQNTLLSSGAIDK